MASAVALGSKTIETRHWPTKYRGLLAIHAARRIAVRELFEISRVWGWCGALGISIGTSLRDTLPFGAVIAVCELADCRPTESFTAAELDAPRHRPEWQQGLGDWAEFMMGNYAPGRFGWVLKNVRRLPAAIPFRGSQGFFDVPDSLLEGATS